MLQIEDMVAEAVQVYTPFNNPITGFCAFTHKAGIHAKAILNNPSTYEIINPADFGMTRYVHFASRLTGWNAVKTRVGQLGLSMTDDQVKTITAKIKQLADIRPIAVDDADAIIRSFHVHVQEGREHEHDVHKLHGSPPPKANTTNGPLKNAVNGLANGTGEHKANGLHANGTAEVADVNGA